MPDPLPPDELGVRLAEVFDVVGPLYRRVYLAVVQSEEEHGVAVGERAVLKMLHDHGPMTVPAMAAEQELSRQFVQRMVNGAAERGLVHVRPNPAHKRSSLIDLAPAGRAAITAILDHEQASLSRAGGAITDQDVRSCLHVLTHLLDAVEGYEPGAEVAPPSSK